MKGYYKDIIAYKRPFYNARIICHPNHITYPCHLLLAKFMKNDPDCAGIKYLAIGKGKEEWDGNVPEPTDDSNALKNEILRYTIKPKDIKFVNKNGVSIENEQGLQGKISSNRIQMEFKIKRDDFKESVNYIPLREFALFGGKGATIEKDSGEMIDYVIHPRIDITTDMTLHRTIRLVFGPDDVSIGEHYKDGLWSLVGKNLPVSAIVGVGKKLSVGLEREGIRTMDDLVKQGFGLKISGVSEKKLQQLRTMARIVLNTELDVDGVKHLKGYTLNSFLKADPKKLARKVSERGVTATWLEQQQGKLGMLEMCLDKDEMKRITLGELMDR
ncbi:MAG: hypothetical protein ACFFCW_31595 [Candidatus Hodarchaeota archaeon]